MIERLKTAWLTPAAVALLVAGLIIVPRERMRGGMTAVIAFVVAASVVVILRLFR